MTSLISKNSRQGSNMDLNRSSNLFANLDTSQFPEFESGQVWLVGAGPGAPGLMTLLGYYALQKAEVVVYDALVNEDIIGWTNKNAKIIFAGKRGGKPSHKQEDISYRLIDHAKRGQRVLRLKGGDPFVFGRGGEECQQLVNAGVPFRIVPGISSGIGGLAYAGIPVTHRNINHSVLFLTGHEADGLIPSTLDWQAVAQASPVIVLYMALKNLSVITNKLIDHGRTPTEKMVIISNATLRDQRVYEMTLGSAANEIKKFQIATPALIVIGPVVEFRYLLDWYGDSMRENTIG